MKLRMLIAVVLLLGSTGCMTAAAAGAGAGAAVLYDDRGVSGKVNGSMDDVFATARAVFQEMGITETAQDIDGTRERELKGTRGDLEITVDIEAETATLMAVDVYAQRSTVDWDRDVARQVLERIMARS